MKQLNDARKAFEQTPIPDSLGKTVTAAVRTGRRAARRPRHSYGWYAAACACLAFIIALNTVPVFALGMQEIPVLGNIARVFTFRQYSESKENILINVNIPALENTGNTELERRINYEILTRMNEEVEEARQRAAEYRQAILDTGGTEEDFWPIDINLDYEIHCSNEEIVSFVITKSEAAASYCVEQFFYNLDLQTGQELDLRHMLGDDFAAVISEQVWEAIADELATDEKASYFEEADAVIDHVPANHNFYIDADGYVVVVFDKYEIAPGYMGIREFTIVPTATGE